MYTEIVRNVIIDKVNKIYDHFEKYFEDYELGEILGVFPYGSMNYGTYVDGISDIDVKVVFVPNFTQVLFKKVYVKEITWQDSLCDVMDLRHLVSNWYKQNINFLEVLYTDYGKVNPKYADIWEAFQSVEKQISNYDIKGGIKSIAGQALHTLGQAKHPARDIADRRKKLANAYRLKVFMNKFRLGYNYKECIRLTGDDVQAFWAIRNGELHPDIDKLEDFFRKRIEMVSPDFVYFNDGVTQYHTRHIMQHEIERAVKRLMENE